MDGASVARRIDRHAGRWAVACAIAAALLCLTALAVFWPGYVAYDSVTQYRQATSGRYDDWHPPAMARLWSLFGDAGPGPMLAVQLGLYGLGFGLIATALAKAGRRHAAVVLLVVALWPPLLGWQAVVLKDTQMLGALLAAIGIVGWWRLRDRPVPPAGWALVVPLLAYAMLVRANAVFAVVPLAAMLARRPARWWLRLGLALAAIAVVIGASGPINHRLLGGASSGVERTQAIYDLAGIGVRTDDPRVGMPVGTLAAIRARGCVRPFFWDPLGEPARCAAEADGLRAMPVARLYGALAVAAVRHPLAYAAHRLAHLNSTERWLVPLHWFGAAPPEGSEANAFDFGAPGRLAWYWQRLAGWLVETPPGWPIVWLVLAAAGVATTSGARDPAAQLARALFVSALALEASFAAISIASDLRYHLWTMAAVAIAWVLVGHAPRRRLLWATLAVALVGATAARLMLPEAPQSYHGMLG